MKSKSAFALIVLSLIATGVSCGKKSGPTDVEIAAMRAENARLKTENEALKKEVDVLKKTPDFIYREGIDLMNENDYLGAKDKFVEVLDKYPTSEYSKIAKEKIKAADREIAKVEAEKRRAEREAAERRKYEPRTEEEAIAEWVNFRNNEALRGTVVTWVFQVKSVYDKYLMGVTIRYCSGWLDTKYTKPVECLWHPDVIISGSKYLAIGDWITVTCTFDYITKDGKVSITAIRIENKGYR